MLAFQPELLLFVLLKSFFMKSLNFWRSLFFSALAAAAFGACSDDDKGGDVDASITVNDKEATTIGIASAGGETEAVSVVSSGTWTLAFESDQDWCIPNITSGKAGTSSLVFTVDPMPAGIEERSATAILTTVGMIFNVEVPVKVSVTVRQSPSGSALPETNVAAVRSLLVAMNPTSTKTDVTAEIGAMTLTGIVVSNSEGKNTGSTWNMAVQDGVVAKNSGLTISSSKFQSASYTPGTCVTVALTGAQVQLYNGLLQLNIADAAAEAVKTVSTEAPEPVVIAPDALFDYESMLVQVDNCYPVSGYGTAWNSGATNTGGNGGNVNFVTTEGQAFVCRTGSSAAFKDQLVPEKMGSLVGIAGRYNNDKQISPRTLADIKLTETIPAPEYTLAKIGNITNGGNYEVEATLLAVYQKGLLLGDETGYTLVFFNDWNKQDSNPYQNDVNKKITVKGAVSEYNGLLQFSAPKTENITIGAANPDYKLPAPVVFDAAGLTAYESAKKYEYVSLTGTLVVTQGTSGGNTYNSYTVIVPGYTAKTVTMAYGLDSYYTSKGLVTGDVVDVKGFALGFDTSKVNIMVREIAKNNSVPSLIFTSSPKTFAGSDPEAQTLSFEARNTSALALDMFSFSGDNADKFNVDGQSDNSVTISAKGNNDSGAPYVAKLVVTVDGNVLAEVDVKQDIIRSGNGYTKIASVADLTAGTYFMAGYLESFSYKNSGQEVTITWAPYSYHLWTGKMATADLATVNYQYEGNQLILDPKLDGSTTAGDITLIAAGADNTYYIKVGEKYLKSTANPAANRKLALVDTTEGAEWLFVDGSGNYAGSIIISNNGVSLGTAGASSALLRSYKAATSLKWGLVFFKAN